jgi:hypothetical protein
MDFVDREPDVVRSIRHRWLLKYWHGLCAKRRVPSWSQVDGQEIALAADGAVVFDVIMDGAEPRYRIRYQGRRLTEVYGADCTGKLLDEVQPPHAYETTRAIYRQALASAQPLYTIAQMHDAEGRQVEHERLILPFGNDGSTVTRFFTMLEIVSPEGAFEQERLLSSRPAMSYVVCAKIGFNRSPSVRRPAEVDTLSK